MKKITAIIVDRANYGRLKPVLQEITASEKLDLSIVVAGSMLLSRFGQAEDIVLKDGFSISSRIYMEVEGGSSTSMAKSIGLGVIEFTSVFERDRPDILLVIGDRYEALAAVIAAAYMNIPIAHIQGGEVSGSIDESARHAISKFSNIHFPSTVRSAQFLIRMGENPDSVHMVGCPAGDYILNLDDDLSDFSLDKVGVGHSFSLTNDFFLVIFHPVTTEITTVSQYDQCYEILIALSEINMPTIWIWPNIDAGSDQISKALRVFREKNQPQWLHLIKNLQPEIFQKLLKRTKCAIGNSSSFVRDSSFTGTPVVLLGDRQLGRELGANVKESILNRVDIKNAILTQISKGRYLPSNIYGDGNAGKRIVKVLESGQVNNKKVLQYIYEDN